MDDEQTTITSHLFTVRLWDEALGDGRSEWRGQVRYVLTGEICYFRRWDQLDALLQRCLPGFALEVGGRNMLE